MPVLSKRKAVLIVCKAINPFITIDLLDRGPEGVQPISGAENIGIKDTLIQLHKQDQKLELHTIDDIIRNIFEYCREEGYSVAIPKGDLVRGDFPTIKDLALLLKATAVPLED